MRKPPISRKPCKAKTNKVLSSTRVWQAVSRESWRQRGRIYFLVLSGGPESNQPHLEMQEIRDRRGIIVRFGSTEGAQRRASKLNAANLPPQSSKPKRRASRRTISPTRLKLSFDGQGCLMADEGKGIGRVVVARFSNSDLASTILTGIVRENEKSRTARAPRKTRQPKQR
jgi:hypothetical protein